MAREAAKRFCSQFGTALDHASWLKVSRAFEQVFVPYEKRPGRKRDAAITAAVADYEAGMVRRSIRSTLGVTAAWAATAANQPDGG